MRLFLVIIICLVSINSSAQNGLINLELQVGPGTGWWTYQRGIDPTSGEAMSWDKSRAAPVFSISFLPSIRLNKFELGADLGACRFYEDKLRTIPTGTAAFRVYDLSERYVNMENLGLILAFSLTKTEKGELLINSKGGIFKINSLHPRREYFDSKMYLSLGMKALLPLGPGKLIVSIDQSNYYIGTSGGREDEKHKLVLLNWRTGYTIRL